MGRGGGKSREKGLTGSGEGRFGAGKGERVVEFGVGKERGKIGLGKGVGGGRGVRR